MKIKRASFFLFGLIIFLFPGQNYYLTLPVLWRPPLVRSLDNPLPEASSYPVYLNKQGQPAITATAGIVIDSESGTVLYQKNPKTPLLPASTVKIMTALVALEHYSLDEVLKVGKTDPNGQDMKLVSGETISVQNLLYGLLVFSANDAAQVLADNYPGGQTEFIAAMNQKAKEIELTDTHFANPTGLDSDKKEKLLRDFSFTTALDLGRLAAWAIKNEVFAQIVVTKEITVTDTTGQIKHKLTNVNSLLGKIDGVRGIKTGWTEEAGECLVSYIVRNNHGLVVVLLQSSDRFGETTKLIDWVFANFQWQEVTPEI